MEGTKCYPTTFSKVGGIFWYPEQREATNIHRAIYSGKNEESGSITDSELRYVLSGWFSYHMSSIQDKDAVSEVGRDRFEILRTLFEAIFHGRTIYRVIPDPSPIQVTAPHLVWFRDGNGAEYELSNASAGERAILPLLIDFANWEINNSIILIDELELHLHPPLQQALVRALPKLGRNNQFIITTHSDYVVGMFGDSQIIRLP